MRTATEVSAVLADAESAEGSPVPAPVATVDPLALEVAAGTTATVATAADEAGSAVATAGEVADAFCSAIALIGSEWPAEGGRRAARAAAAALAELRSAIVAVAGGWLAAIAAE